MLHNITQYQVNYNKQFPGFLCFAVYFMSLLAINIAGDHLFSTYIKFSEKITFRTPWYVHVRVRIMGKKC